MMQGAEYPKENTGFFYFTMVGLTNAPTTSEHVMHVDQLDGTILPHQLQAVMDLYNHNCRPSQLQTPVFAENLHWTKAGHVSGAYSELSDWRFKSEFSTSGGERVRPSRRPVVKGRAQATSPCASGHLDASGCHDGAVFWLGMCGV